MKKSKTTQESYEKIVQDMRDLYHNQISTADAHAAARNLIGFCLTILAIKKRMEHDIIHAKLP